MNHPVEASPSGAGLEIVKGSLRLSLSQEGGTTEAPLAGFGGRRRRYALLGLALAAAELLGILLIRLLENPSPPSLSWVVAELRRDASLYLYLTLSGGVLLALLGWLAGRREERLRAESRLDHLTGLANRRHFEARLQHELVQRKRHRRPLSILVVDLDHLKELNDSWGHHHGDMALRTLAESFQETCRASDLPARLGGDEFGVIAPYTTAAEGQELARRLSTTLRQRSPAREGLPALTVSVGIADSGVLSAEEEEAEALLEAADGALYHAKAAGRDRAVVAATKRSTNLARVPRVFSLNCHR